jgi:RNA polymerase sigma factor (sigma-70 family)
VVSRVKTIGSNNELLPDLFRREYAKMTAVLCRHFGLQQIQIAEDIASETFLKASENWAVYGVPENPVAWLYLVAKNKAKDYLKRLAIFESKVKEHIESTEIEKCLEFEFSDQVINDSHLAMIFAVCNPAISTEGQICLALQTLCGFSVEEIANAFVLKTETIKKRLLRARNNLRRDRFQIKALNEKEVQLRLDTVLRTLYLLFNEGYFSKSNDNLIKKELCSEAMTLTLTLTENTLTNITITNALLALMCFQSSRLNARMSNDGEAVNYELQDRNLWDDALIQKGNYYLVNAFQGNALSKYHLEAAIAYWHTNPANAKRWHHILQLYDQLLLMEYSPVIALNRTFAFAKVYGSERAIVEAEKLNMTDNKYYHELLGYFYAETDISKAIIHYENAIHLTRSKAGRLALKRAIQQLLIKIS